MPTYQYVCTKCNHEFEVFQPITADALEVCPKEHCGRRRWGKGRVKRLLSGGAGLIFKGSGFYSTDYRSDSYKQAAKKDSEAAKPKPQGESKGSGAASSSGKGTTPAAGSGGNGKPAAGKAGG